MKRHFDNEFKTTILELLKSGKNMHDICEEYNLQSGMVRRWRREYKEKNGDLSKKRELTATEIEVLQLKKELREAKLERDILKKAVSIFSKSDT